MTEEGEERVSDRGEESGSDVEKRSEWWGRREGSDGGEEGGVMWKRDWE